MCADHAARLRYRPSSNALDCRHLRIIITNFPVGFVTPSGLSPLPQPALWKLSSCLKKPHARTSKLGPGICMLSLSFKFFRRAVAQSRVQSLPIVILLDEFFDVRTQMLYVVIRVRVDFFPLQSLDEAFATGVVIRVRGPAHARNHPMLLKDGDVFFAGVLHSAIGMMDQAWRGLSFADGLFQDKIDQDG